jgi:hypothetical protein
MRPTRFCQKEENKFGSLYQTSGTLVWQGVTVPRAVSPKLGGAHQSGAHKIYENAPKLNYKL